MQLQKVQTVLNKVNKIESDRQNQKAKDKQNQLRLEAEQQAVWLLEKFNKIFTTCDFKVGLTSKVEQVKKFHFIPYLIFELQSLSFVLTDVTWVKACYRITCFSGTQQLESEDFNLYLGQSREAAIKPILEFVTKYLESFGGLK